MLRGGLEKSLDHDPNFRWRGESVTRVENLSDIVFALALGMLVAPSQSLKTFDDLQLFLLSAAPVALGFMILLQIWYSHFTFFRRYGISDGRTLFYNACLLFAVMYLAYPLRLMFDGLFSYFLGYFDDFARMNDMRMSYERSGTVVGYFAVGYGVINAVFVLMYRHAMAQTQTLDLTDAERTLTQKSRFKHIGAVVINLIVGGLALFSPLNSLASLAYLLNIPLGIVSRRKFKLSAPMQKVAYDLR